MKTLFKTARLSLNQASENDIPYIMRLEHHPENRNFVAQGSLEQHIDEINDESYLVFIVKLKYDKIGYMICHMDTTNNSFELRRLVIESKGQGYGKETILGLIDYAMVKLSFQRFWLDVYEDNVTGIKLYESIGMELEGTLKKSVKRNDEFISRHVYSIVSNS